MLNCAHMHKEYPLFSHCGSVILSIRGLCRCCAPTHRRRSPPPPPTSLKLAALLLLLLVFFLSFSLYLGSSIISASQVPHIHWNDKQMCCNIESEKKKKESSTFWTPTPMKLNEWEKGQQQAKKNVFNNTASNKNRKRKHRIWRAFGLSTDFVMAY